MTSSSEKIVRCKRDPIDIKSEYSEGDPAGELNIYDTSHPYTILSYGAPGPDLLKLCTDNFSAATDYLRVISYQLSINNV